MSVKNKQFEKWSLKQRLIERSKDFLIINSDILEEHERATIINDINLLEDNNDIKQKLLEVIAYSKYRYTLSADEILDNIDEQDFSIMELIVLILL